MIPAAADHRQLMDSVYRGQRHIYDATRKFYLFGRDRLINNLALPSGGSVLEIGCGTGRNLAMIARRWPDAELFGLDISAEMLKSAAKKLRNRAILAQGDAASFDPAAVFGRSRFDRVVLSFTTSMIPGWTMALTQAISCVASNGALHIVDFGTMKAMPAPFRVLLTAWLDRFHVSPRAGLTEFARALAAQFCFSATFHRGPGDYYVLIELRHHDLETSLG